MRVSQADYRTVRVETGGLTLLLRYGLYQDDEERLPESIACDGNTVVAYFLASTIRDVIGETPYGFYVERRWKILHGGRFALTFTLDLSGIGSVPFLFPGAVAGTRPPSSPLRVAESRTAYPNALYVFTEPEGLLVFSDPEPKPEEQGSVSLQGLQGEARPAARLELRYPDATRPPHRQPRRRRQLSASPCLLSTGSLERAHRLNVVCAPQAELYERGTAAVLERLQTASAGEQPPAGDRLPDTAQLKTFLDREIQHCLDERLVQQGGVCGLRLKAGGNTLSTLASCGLALLLLRLYPGKPQPAETALRLADFTLKAQHPGGLFYESFDLAKGVWLDSLPSSGGPSSGGPGNAGPAVPAETSATVALRLAQIAGLLSRGKPHAAGVRGARYLHAARRLGDALIAVDPRFEEIGECLEVDGLHTTRIGFGGLAFLELYGELHTLTGKDPYRKAWSALRNRFFTGEAGGQAPRADTSALQHLPLPGGQNADLHQALLEARVAALAAPASPMAPVGPAGPRLERLRRCFSDLLPWIYLNAPAWRSQGPGPAAAPPGADTPTMPIRSRSPVGGLVPALSAGELALRGFETAYLLLSLDRQLGKRRPLPVLKQLVVQLVSCTLQGPVGGALPLSVEGTPERKPAPPDARTLVGEMLHLQRLLVEFPALFRQAAGRVSAVRKARSSSGAGTGRT